MHKYIVSFLSLVIACVVAAPPAAAECNCVAVASEVAAEIRDQVARADALYAAGDYHAALEMYADAYARSQDSALLYAQGMAHWQLGASAEARAKLEEFVAAGGRAELRASAEAAVGHIESGVDRAGDLVGGVAGGVVGGVGAGGEVVGGVTGRATAKPKKIAKGAAIVLGVVAVVAVGAIAYKGIRAARFEDPEEDFPKDFGLGMGLSGVVMGATAFYLWGLTGVTGAAAAACVADAPVIAPAGKSFGLAAALTF
jgi:hypothetical protein